MTTASTGYTPTNWIETDKKLETHKNANKKLYRLLGPTITVDVSAHSA